MSGAGGSRREPAGSSLVHSLGWLGISALQNEACSPLLIEFGVVIVSLLLNAGGRDCSPCPIMRELAAEGFMTAWHRHGPYALRGTASSQRQHSLFLEFGSSTWSVRLRRIM